MCFQGTADTASVGANREGDDFMKLMKALEISASTKEDPEQASTKHGDKQKVWIYLKHHDITRNRNENMCQSNLSINEIY